MILPLVTGQLLVGVPLMNAVEGGYESRKRYAMRDLTAGPR